MSLYNNSEKAFTKHWMKFDKLPELFDIKDFGDVPEKKVDTGGKVPSNMKEFADVVGCNQVLSKMVQEVLAEGRMCVTLGGDHALGVGKSLWFYNLPDNDATVYHKYYI